MRDAAVLDALIEQYPYKPYRNHRILSRARQARVLRAEIDRLLTHGAVSMAAGTGEAGAVAFARQLPWDSGFFGIPMGRIDYLLRGAAADRAALASVVQDALTSLRSQGVKHVALKLDVADVDGIAAAENAGFRLMDALVTYISHPRRTPPRAIKQVGAIRLFEPRDTAQILDITREAYSGYRGRFQVDPHIPADRSTEFYLEWARKCCSGEMADRIFVSEDATGKLIGWASVKNAEPVSSVGGAPISAGSLGACRAETPGAYGALICAAATENHRAGVLTEAQTQNSNFAMVRVLESVGAIYARAEYTFHAWLG